MNQEAFFGHIRAPIFGGVLNQKQVNGLNKILAYQQEKYPALSLNEFAYILATATWETAHQMRPIQEGGSHEYLRSKPYWPYIGEGLIQVTWRANYEKFGAHKPGDLLQWPMALYALFHGMIDGVFTGKKLSDFFTPHRADWIHAREIVNDLDHADDISKIAQSYATALEAAGYERAPPQA